MRKKRVAQLVSIFLILGLTIGSVYGAFLTYKSYVEIYGEKYPLGLVELDIRKMEPIEGLEAREDYIGEIRVWTYSNNTELILQLVQVSQIVYNFRSFTVKVCLPLDVIFVVDEGNMEAYMATVKEQLAYLVDVLPLMNKMPVRFGVVGFRDYPAELRVLSLTDDYAAVKTFIASLTATAGGAIPQSHYLGLRVALNDFDANSAIDIDKLVIFVTDAQAGFNNNPSFDEAKVVADALAERGVKIHAVLCGPDEYPENAQLKYYAHVSVGNYIGPQGQHRIVAGSTSNPTWIVKLTPITPFDSFRFKLNSSPPCEQEGFYTLSIYVDFFANAIPWHDFFLVELMAHLEKAEIPPPATMPSNSPCDYDPGTVFYLGKDSVTQGDWENAVGSPIGVYGTYAHILPNPPKNWTQIPVGNFSVPVGGFDYTDYGWTPNQISGLPFNRTDPTYWDEYVSLDPKINYTLTGTLQNVPGIVDPVQYPAFAWAWDNFNSSDPRAAHFKTNVPGAGGPGTRLTCWDDGSERDLIYSMTSEGYLNVTLDFPNGVFMLSLYAYDISTAGRPNQTIHITNEAGEVLTSAVMEEPEFEGGIYHQFIVCGPATIIVHVKRGPESINAVLSGVFVDKLECSRAADLLEN